ncbi:MAG: hypothetical protein ACK5PQ_03075 [Alphaproteobacteria bacterium]
MPSKNYLTVSTGQEIRAHFESRNSTTLFVPAFVLNRLGAPVLACYQKNLPNCCSLVVECQTPGQALNCLYHGIHSISYVNKKKHQGLFSIAQHLGAHIIYKN